MDGYTFMIERNRRLIEHEARIANAQSQDTAAQDLRAEEAAAQADIRKLYVELEGCGRKAGSDPSNE